MSVRGGTDGGGGFSISPDLLNLPGIARRRNSTQEERKSEEPSGTDDRAAGADERADGGASLLEQLSNAPGIMGRQNPTRKETIGSIAEEKSEDEARSPRASLTVVPAITRRHSYSDRDQQDSFSKDDSNDDVFSEEKKTGLASTLASLTVASPVMRRRHSSKVTEKDRLAVPDGKGVKDDTQLLAKKSRERVVVRRSSLRRRPTKDKEEKAEEKDFSHMKPACDKIVEKVHAEKAVQNTIEALVDRWKMIMFMYEDLVAVMEKKKTRDARNKLLKKQFEMAMLGLGACAVALPILGIVTILWIF